MDTMIIQFRAKAKPMLGSQLRSAFIFVALVLSLSCFVGLAPASEPSTRAAEDLVAIDQGVLYPVLVGGKIGFIDRNGNYAIEPSSDSGGIFLEEGLVLSLSEHSQRILDRHGRVLLQSAKPIARLGRGRFGVPDKEGQMRAVGLVEPFSSEVRFTGGGMPGSEGLIPVRIGDKWGFLDDSGKLAIAARFDGAVSFRNGLAAVLVSGKWGYIDHMGEFVILPQFVLGKQFDEGLAPVTLDGKSWRYIDPTGREAFAGDFAGAGAFCEGLAAARDKSSGLYGFIDKSGKLKIPGRYKRAGSFSEGLADVSIRGQASGYVDHKGEFVIKFPTDNTLLWPFSHGLALVEVNGRTGYIDRIGQWVWSIDASRWNTE